MNTNLTDPSGKCAVNDDGKIAGCIIIYKEGEVEWTDSERSYRDLYEETLQDVGKKIQEGDNPELQEAWDSIKKITFAPDRDCVDRDGKIHPTVGADNRIQPEPGDDRVTIYRRAFDPDQGQSRRNRTITTMHEITHGTRKNRGLHFLNERSGERSTRTDTRKYIDKYYPNLN